MYQVNAACMTAKNFEANVGAFCESPGTSAPDPGQALERGLELFDLGLLKEADEVLTSATMLFPEEPDLWLAAGICRLHRGAMRSAAAAFKMCRWLSHDREVEELLELSLELTRRSK